MSTSVRGEVQFAAAGQTFTLVYTTNALCRLEEHLGAGVGAIAGMVGDLAKVRLLDIRTLLWAGLQEHHPMLDTAAVGRIMDAIGVLESVELIMRAFSGAFPRGGDAEAGGDGPLARATHVGTGTLS